MTRLVLLLRIVAALALAWFARAKRPPAVLELHLPLATEFDG